jgi:aspartyl-tRNA(Asn)/glutamyl-tRNA(Gln) amidotransferase subunit C
MALISKHDLEHLANLARLELTEHEEERFLKDLEDILGHVRELGEVKTEGVAPMAGGISLKNVTRNDGDEAFPQLPRDGVVEAFPESERGLLKVPSVFDAR